jgi:hypothetical protein
LLPWDCPFLYIDRLYPWELFCYFFNTLNFSNTL